MIAVFSGKTRTAFAIFLACISAPVAAALSWLTVSVGLRPMAILVYVFSFGQHYPSLHDVPFSFEWWMAGVMIFLILIVVIISWHENKR